jgi:hypothetical protein
MSFARSGGHIISAVRVTQSLQVLDWSAKETAELLRTSVASVNAALRRARTTMQKHHGQQREIARRPVTASFFMVDVLRVTEGTIGEIRAFSLDRRLTDALALPGVLN